MGEGRQAFSPSFRSRIRNKSNTDPHWNIIHIATGIVVMNCECEGNMNRVLLLYYGRNRGNKCGRSEKAYLLRRIDCAVIGVWGRANRNGRFVRDGREQIWPYSSELRAQMEYYKKMCKKLVGKKSQGRGYKVVAR
jgi:hypothetical protein